MKPSDKEYDSKLNIQKTDINFDPISLLEKETTTNSNINDIRLASLKIRDYIQTSPNDTTKSTLIIPKIKFNNNNIVSINPWQELKVSSTPSYSKTKSIHINNVDNTYQHASSVLSSNDRAILTINKNHSVLWNRANNSGVWRKSYFMNRLQVPPRRQLLNTDQQQSTNCDV